MPARPKQRAAASVPACPAMVSKTGGRADTARTGLSSASATGRGSIAGRLEGGNSHAAPQRVCDVAGDRGGRILRTCDEPEERPEAERGGLPDEVQARDRGLEFPREPRGALDPPDVRREPGPDEGQPRDVGDVAGAADDVIDGEIALASVVLAEREAEPRPLLARARHLDVAEDPDLSLDALPDPPGAPGPEVVLGQAHAPGVGHEVRPERRALQAEVEPTRTEHRSRHLEPVAQRTRPLARRAGEVHVR